MEENILSKTILENSIITNLLRKKNNEKILLPNLSSKIWEPEEFSKIMNKFEDNEKSNIFFFENNMFEYEFLKIRKFTIPKKENFQKYIINKYDKDKREKLIEHILSLNVTINKFNINHSLSPLIPINNLLNELNINQNLNDSFNNIKYYRKIKNDGNSFYRIIIFQIFEFIILKNKINSLRSIIYDIYMCYSDSITKNYLNKGKLDKIKPNLIFQILISIYLKCEENNIELGYKIFLISINSCKSFDEGLIWYYRYILYKFIKENELNHFSKNFNIKIENLLPEKYENNDNFKFNEFYENNLLKLYNNVEKIVIYITPFIFGININLISIDDKIKKLSYEGKSILEIDESINIFYKDNYYELLYNKEYFQNNKNILFNYINEEFIEEKGEIKNKNLNINNKNIKYNFQDRNDLKEKKIINKQTNNDIGMINNNSQNQNTFSNKDKNEDLENNKLINTNINEQYNEDFLSYEQQNIKNNNYINKNKCEKCNKNNKENGFNLCISCINEMVDNKCFERYLLSIKNNEIFEINNIIFENYDYSLDKLIKFLKYPNKKKYLNYIKSKICVNCKNKKEKCYAKFFCGCYECENCYNPITYINFYSIPSFLLDCPRCRK